MIGHYMITAFRALRRQKAVTAINILCLALGLAAFIVASSVVRYLETSERHFSKADRIFVVSTELTFPDGQRPLNTLVTPDHAAKYVREEFPELEAVARVQRMGDTALAAGPDVWEIAAALRDSGLRGDAAVDAVAADLDLSPARVRIALAYYGAHSAEIDDEIADNERAAEAALRSWESQRRLLA